MMTNDLLCKRIVEESQDAILFSDREGIIRLWNSGAERIFGYSPEEAQGQSLDIIIPEQLRERHWTAYHTVMETGVSKYRQDLLAVPALRKDGSRISIEFTIVPLKDEQGRMLGAGAVIRDVTDRWQKEKNMKKRLNELEGQLRQTG